MKRMEAIRPILVLLLFSHASVIQAENLISTPKEFKSNYLFPFPGRILGSATVSDIGVFSGEGMLPFLGNKNNFLYWDLLAQYGIGGTYLISPGLGYRTTTPKVMLGGYVFADYSHAHSDKKFWIINPGIEAIGLKWDLHLNAYLPTRHGQILGPSVRSSFEVGTHNQYSQSFNRYAVLGNWYDTEIGYSFPLKNELRGRIHVGGYYYNTPANYGVKNIAGITGGVNKSVNKNHSVKLLASYDRLNKYKIGVSINMSFGGEVNTFSSYIEDRKLDPVQRHIGILSSGGGTYAQIGDRSTSANAIEYSNVYFLSPSGTGDGTYGNPAPLSQATIDTINTNSPDSARIYLQGNGRYTISEQHIYLYNGQNIYGRTNDFLSTAIGSSRPILYQPTTASNYAVFYVGAHGDSTNEFSDMQFTTDFVANSDVMGLITLGSTTNLTFTNSSFSSFSGNALYLGSGTINTTITNSLFYNNSSAVNFTSGSGNLIIQDTLVTTDSDFSVGTTSNPSGLSVINGGSNTITFQADNLTINLNGTAAGAQGIQMQNQASGALNATLNHLTILGAGQGGADGLAIYNGTNTAYNGSMNITVENSLISDNGSSSGNGNIYLTGENGGVLNFNLLNTTTSQSAGYGMLVVNNNLNDTINVTVDNSTFDSGGLNLGAPYPFGNVAVWSLGEGSINLSATNSTISNTTNAVPALWISNDSGPGSLIDVTSLNGTKFVNNNNGGIYAYTKHGTSTTVNYTGATFTSSTPNIATDPTSTGAVTWTPPV